MTDWNLCEFQKYVKNEFGNLLQALNRQQDGRATSSVCIDASQLVYSFFFQVLLGLDSIHQLDQWLRGSLAAELLNINPDEHSGSDSTLLQAADGWNLPDIRAASQALVKTLRRLGYLTFKCSCSSVVRPAILDGSCFGSHRFSVLTLAGNAVQAPLDIEPYSKRGKERSASFRLLERLKQSFDSVPFTHLLLDGLYMSRSVFIQALELDFAPVVKTTDKSLSCVRRLQENWQDFFGEKTAPDHIRWLRGTDSSHGYSYKILQNCQISWGKFELNGIQLQITYLSGPRSNRCETFWVFTTDTELSAQSLRQLAHHRWAIENNEFKELNQLVGSKASYIKSEEAKHTILFWQMIGWALFQAFRHHCEKLLETMAYGQTITKSWLIQQLKEQTYQHLANAPPQ